MPRLWRRCGDAITRLRVIFGRLVLLPGLPFPNSWRARSPESMRRSIASKSFPWVPGDGREAFVWVIQWWHHDAHLPSSARLDEEAALKIDTALRTAFEAAESCRPSISCNPFANGHVRAGEQGTWHAWIAAPRACRHRRSAGAGGGTRTLTRFRPRRILNPLRLPIPPLRPAARWTSRCHAERLALGGRTTPQWSTAASVG